ncbi:HAMP domain-containing sensor histidine kinase [Hydrogenophaga sp.]|uniref:sensor histidine kinase n=1 Tax=Hydrogenophaga sp. TaxID=1904254 RepID=UPI0025C70819|nr:HAMP domain-containing sensor histidine kinase [Hydrogenophaga sp.]
MNSIRQRLLLWQIGALIVTGVLVSVLTYLLAWNGFNRIRDYGLEQIAYSVVRHGVKPALVRPLMTPAPGSAPLAQSTATEAENDGEATEDLGQFVSQIWDDAGQLVYSSLDNVGPPLQPHGFHVVRWEDEDWRVYTVADRRQVVQVAVTSANRTQGFADLVPWLLVPLGLLVLLLSLLIHTAVTQALLPLDQLGREIGRREVNDLHPVPADELPDELQPLASALNQLLERVDQLLSGQRQFIADVAHELNTPLAAVKLQAQLARRVSEGERSAALDELDQGIARAAHLVAQLLQMARLEPELAQRQNEVVRLDLLANQVVAAFSAQAEAHHIDLGRVGNDSATVVGDPSELRVLLNNLVSNALRHTTEGSRVDVRVSRSGDEVSLAVSDDGPGIDPDQREAALQRFVRLNPQQGHGSGLGLAIVSRIVQQHQGRLTLDETPGGGLTVRVQFRGIEPPTESP